MRLFLVLFFLLFIGCESVPVVEFPADEEYRRVQLRTDIGSAADIVIQEKAGQAPTVYLANFSDQSIVVFDLNSNQVTNHIPLTFPPMRLALDSKGGHLYIAGSQYLAQLETVKTSVKTVTLSKPVQINNLVYSPKDSSLYFNDFASATIYAIRDFPKAGEVLELESLPRSKMTEMTPLTFVVDDGAEYAFVSKLGDASVDVMDLVSGGRRMTIGLTNIKSLDFRQVHEFRGDLERFTFMMAAQNGWGVVLDVRLVRRSVDGQRKDDRAAFAGPIQLWKRSDQPTPKLWASLKNRDERQTLTAQDIFVAKGGGDRSFVYSNSEVDAKYMKIEATGESFTFGQRGSINFGKEVVRMAVSLSGEWIVASLSDGSMVVMRRTS